MAGFTIDIIVTIIIVTIISMVILGAPLLSVQRSLQPGGGQEDQYRR